MLGWPRLTSRPFMKQRAPAATALFDHEGAPLELLLVAAVTPTQPPTFAFGEGDDQEMPVPIADLDSICGSRQVSD